MAWMPPTAMGEVILNMTNGYPFYHVEHILKAGEFTTTHPEEFIDPRYPDTKRECEFGENGFFTIYVSKAHFPIDAPNCKSKWLKLTMPGRSTEAGIQGKRYLWNQIKSVESGEMNELTVIVELNPYASITSAEPFTVELDYCNISFRTAWGEYIPHTEKIVRID